jgi:calcyclin binding protein
MSNTEQQIQELNADIDDIKSLVDQSNRPRVKQYLELQQRRFETELITLKEKTAAATTATATATTEKKPTATVPSTTNRSYTKEITLYAWDQTDKFVKIYVQNLDGVGGLPSEQIRCSFETGGYTLEINNLKNINYVFKRTRLLHDIKPEQSSYKVKKDMVIVSLAKADPKNWECILRDEKKAPEKPAVPQMDDNKDPGDSLMKLMKNMYETGDDEMKRTIAKAWTESREKMNTGAGADGSGMPGF